MIFGKVNSPPSFFFPSKLTRLSSFNLVFYAPFFVTFLQFSIITLILYCSKAPISSLLRVLRNDRGISDFCGGYSFCSVKLEAFFTLSTELLSSKLSRRWLFLFFVALTKLSKTSAGIYPGLLFLY
jgi:hypothetical protein